MHESVRLDHAWYIHEIMYVPCMVHTRNMHGRCMINAQFRYKSCMALTCTMHGPYIVYMLCVYTCSDYLYYMYHNEPDSNQL